MSLLQKSGRRAHGLRSAIAAFALATVLAGSAQAQTNFGPGPGGNLVDAGVDPGEFSSDIVVNLPGTTITQMVSVTLTGLTHTFLGDLRISLEKVETGQLQVLTSPPDFIPADLNGTYTFVVNPLIPTLDEAAFNLGANAVVPSGNLAISDYGGGSDPGLRVDYSTFDGVEASGTWRLLIVDFAAQDSGTLTSWSFSAFTSGGAAIPEPATATLLGVGFAAGAWAIRRRTR